MSVLSDMTESECIAFVKAKGVEIPEGDLSDDEWMSVLFSADQKLLPQVDRQLRMARIERNEQLLSLM